MKRCYRNILLVEEEAPVVQNHRKALESCGYSVKYSSNDLDALKTVLDDRNGPSLVLLDVDPSSSTGGRKTAESILKHKDLPIVFLTSHKDPILSTGTDSVCYGYVFKDSDAATLSTSIAMAFRLFENEKAADQQRTHLERICSLAKIGSWEYFPEDHKLSLSSEACRILEIPDGTDINLDILLGRLSNESSDLLLRAINLAVDEAKPFVSDTEIVLPSGTLKRVRILGEAIQASSVQPRQVFGTLQDVSEFRLINRVVQESALTLNQIEQIAHVGHWAVNPVDGSFFHSDETKRIFGYEPSEYALSVEEAINAYHPDDRAEVIRLFKRAVDTGEGYEFNLRIVQPTGRIRNVHSKGTTEKNADGKVIRVYGVFQDITEIVKSMELLEQSRTLLRASLESQKDTILLSIDRKYCYFYFNKAHADIMKIVYDVDIQIGMNLLDCVTIPEDRKVAQSNYDRALRGESHSNIGKYGAEGRQSWFESFFNPICNDRNEIIGATVMARDISERKRAEEALQESHNRYHALFEQAGDGIITLDNTGKILSVNDTYALMHGYSVDEIRTIPLEEFFFDHSAEAPEKTTARIVRILAGDTLSFEVEHRHKGGHILSLQVTANLVAAGADNFIMAIYRDLSERKRMQEEMLKIQKLDSLGVLAGGIAHDFNNLLSGILGFISIAADMVADREVSTYLDKALDTIDRGRSLTGQLLTFAKGGAPMKTLEQIGPCIKKNAEFALSGSNVSCRFSIPNDLWSCEFDRNQIGQVVDNIVINALQAMPAGGNIEIAAENLRLPEGSHRLLPEGDYVRIQFRDHGIGIPESLLLRIFDPFFTTKPSGHGLGLATSFSIVRRHGGCIDVESALGMGSTFTVFLPAVSAGAVHDTSGGTAVHAGSGLVLVMDHEEVVRETLGSMLKSMGYEVYCVSKPREAIDLFKHKFNENKPFRAVFFDLTIPGGLGGKETIYEIRNIYKDIVAFVTSGYLDDPSIADPKAYGFDGSIRKPFRKAELAELLNKHFTKSR